MAWVGNRGSLCGRLAEAEPAAARAAAAAVKGTLWAGRRRWVGAGPAEQVAWLSKPGGKTEQAGSCRLQWW